MSARESFNPESYELDKSFRLTRFTELKGTGCKVPQDVLQKLLESLQENHFQEDEQFLGAVMPRLGMWTTLFFPTSKVEHLGCSVVNESKTGIFSLFFVFFRAASAAYGGSQARGLNLSCSCQSTPQPQQCGIRTMYSPYTTVRGNARSWTHWVRPGIKPTSLWILVGFITTEPRQELFFFFFSARRIQRAKGW